MLRQDKTMSKMPAYAGNRANATQIKFFMGLRIRGSTELAWASGFGRPRDFRKRVVDWTNHPKRVYESGSEQGKDQSRDRAGAAVICASTNQINSLTRPRGLVDDTSTPPGLIPSQKTNSAKFYSGAKPLHSNTEVSPARLPAHSSDSTRRWRCLPLAPGA